jgi:two-component system, NarL family, sensor histidine kinase UhpB
MSQAGTGMKSVRILMVEDSEADAIVIIRHLAREAGYRAICHRVETAEEMEQALNEPWDVVIADQHLPNFSAWAALELLKDKGVEIPLLLVSGIVPEEDGAALMKAGAHDCVTKDKLARLGPALERTLKEVEFKNQRNLAAKALEKSEERYRRLVEVCPDCIVILRDERVVFVNQAGLAVFGAEAAEQIEGKALSELLVSRLEPDLSQQLVEDKIVRLDGALREVEIASASFYDEQGRLVQLVIRDVSDRHRLEREVVRISEHEQQRLGEDLHDGVYQKLVGLKFKLAALEGRLREKTLAETRDAAALLQVLDMVLQETHSLAYGLCPAAVDKNGLVWALRDLARTTETVFGIKCRVLAQGASSWADSHYGTQLFRIAQESISNAVKHGKASRVAVGLVMGAKGARISISDNGAGIGAPIKADKGMGIKIMRYRADRIGAKLHITRRATRGTRVVCECWPPAAPTTT